MHITKKMMVLSLATGALFIGAEVAQAQIIISPRYRVINTPKPNCAAVYRAEVADCFSQPRDVQQCLDDAYNRRIACENAPRTIPRRVVS